jgi:YVTN family beta-propeller protein
VARIDASTLSVSWITRLMNLNMALAVRPTDGRLAVVGTDGTNEVRFEPVLKGRFLHVLVALTDGFGGGKSVVDLNGHLTYAVPSIPQAERDKSIGDPRGVVWNAAGTRAYVAGMGSNNVVVLDTAGARAGLAPTIEVGEGPTGLVLDASGSRLFVLNKFDSSISVVSTATETETTRVLFHDASPPAVKVGRKHLYDTRKNSGLGQIACGSCHVDARMDRLSWDLGDPAGDVAPVAGNNLGANIPGLNGGFQDFHPMKGPMLTQTLQDIIGKEPHHWRADRKGLESFSGAFVGLQGDDTTLTAQEMQEFEDFLGTIHFPPNPFRNFDNSLPTSLPLPGHFTTGRFAAAGQPLPTGNAVTGLSRYRPPTLLDGGAVACVTCHTLPVGIGTDYQGQPPFFTTLAPIPPGPNGERHHMLVSQDGATNVSIKVPQLRNLYERSGFNTTQSSNRAGAGYLHDGSVDSIERFIAEPIFNVVSDQDVANILAFMLSFSGSDLPAGTTNTLALEPPGTPSQDSHAAVGAQTTLVTLGGASPQQVALMGSMLSLANAGKVGLVAKGRQAGLARGWRYNGAGIWQSDRAAESLGTATLQALAAVGSELTFTVVPAGSQTRLGIDRDLDGVYDRDELDACSDPANAASLPGNWTDLGSGLAGTHGVPGLSGCGSLLAGDTVSLSLTGALENTSAHLLIGVAAVNLPFKGGTLVPAPDLTLLFLPTGGAGSLELSGPLAPGLPSGFALYLQYWINDPAGPVGFAASNALRGMTP